MPVIEATGEMSTQDGFGKVLDAIARSDTPLADRIVTTSPDVTVSTNLGPWVNRRGLFALRHKQDVFKERGLLSPQRWEMTPEGQHIETWHCREQPVLAAGSTRAFALAVRRASVADRDAL